MAVYTNVSPMYSQVAGICMFARGEEMHGSGHDSQSGLNLSRLSVIHSEKKIILHDMPFPVWWILSQHFSQSQSLKTH